MTERVVLVTGANGFVGRAVSGRFREAGWTVRHAVRDPAAVTADSGTTSFGVGDVNGTTDWRTALAGADIVVHLAARVHIMHDAERDPAAAFRAINVDGTRRLAEQAAASGVRRVVFVSTIKVNGEETSPGRPFRAEGPRDAHGDYATSKLEAEDALTSVASATGLEATIIRPPLVYGPGVKANFLTMMRWVHRGIPLPFGSVKNQRSLVFVGNLADLIFTSAAQSAAANQVFLAADGEDLSTPELLRRLANALQVPSRLVPVPVRALKVAAGVIGRRAEVGRLCGTLQVDIGRARTLLGWSPPWSVDEALALTASSYLASVE